MAEMTFENAMKQLEQIVRDLESGDLALEKSIQKFEKGIGLSKYCTQKLDETEKKITILMKDTEGGIHEESFNPEDRR